MICSFCDHENPDGARFCNHCGLRQEWSPGELAPGAQVGAPDRRSERRQLTVMFCDLVGSTHLAEHIDPEELREVMARYHATCSEAIARFDGYVAQYLGDGILAYFGFPQAHENDADRAVRSALEIQRHLTAGLAAGRLRARIGIHTGLVVVGDVGNLARRETLALGSATNIAARIQGFAAEGGIAISEATQRLATNISVRDLGPQRIRGLDDTLRVYAVDRVFTSVRQLGAPATELFGRAEELHRLRHGLDEASKGRGGIALVSGEPGIGKSRLIQALRSEAVSAPGTWIAIACSPFSSGSALRPVISLFEERFGLGLDGGRALGAERVVEGLQRVPGLRLEDVVPYLLLLLGLPVDARFPLPPLTPELLRERTMSALRAIAEALAAQQRVVIEVEDLHWADPSTLQYIERLAELAPKTRLLVLCTARPEWKAPWPAVELEQLELGRLSFRHALEMVDSLARERGLSSEAKQGIVERSDGVPLFVEHLTREVLEAPSASDSEAESQSRAEQPIARAIPSTLFGLLMARLDRLGVAKRVAQVAATLGREFSFDLLDALAAFPTSLLVDGLDRLVEAELIVPLGTPPKCTYRFTHALVQETAYQSLLRADRRAIHASVAEALGRLFPGIVASDPGLAARHFAEARLHDRAAAHHHAAGVLAAERFANREATLHFRNALASLSELPPSTARRERELAACLALAPPLIVSRGLDHPEVQALHERIDALCSSATPGVGQLPALLYLSRYSLRRGAVDESARVGERILQIAKDDEIPLMEAIGRLILGSCEISRSPASTAIAHLERALEVASTVDLPPPTSSMEPELLAYIHATFALALAVGGRFDAAAKQVDSARTRASAARHEPTRILVLALSTITLSFMTDFEATLVCGREALSLSEGRGFHTSEAQAHTMRGWARTALGDPAGIDEAEAGLSQAIEIGFRGGLCQYVVAAAEANRLVGRYARAQELLDLAQTTHEATGEAVFAGRIRRMRGMLYLVQGERDQAEAELRAALPLLDRFEARAELLMAATELLRIAQGHSEQRSMRARLSAIYASLPGGGSYRPLREARALLEEVSGSGAAWSRGRAR